MSRKLATSLSVLSSALFVWLAAPAIASAHDGADGVHHHCHHHFGHRETALTGSTLASAEQAAVNANPGSTAKAGFTDTHSKVNGAAYKVYIVQANGKPALVIEDSNFNVLRTVTGHRCRHGHFTHNRRAYSHAHRSERGRRDSGSRHRRLERRHHRCH
jgi:hypothetical protein